MPRGKDLGAPGKGKHGGGAHFRGAHGHGHGHGPPPVAGGGSSPAGARGRRGSQHHPEPGASGNRGPAAGPARRGAPARGVPEAGRRRTDVIRLKVVSMGPEAVGKSCLIKRFCEDSFVAKYTGTIGVDYGVKSIKYADMHVRVNLFDLAGGEQYLDVRNEFYKDAQGCILVYDAGKRATFEALEGWLRESAKYGAPNLVTVVVANKNDSLHQEVPTEEGEAWATSKGYPFFAASAASGEGVKQVFRTLFFNVLSMIPGVPDDVVAAACSSISMIEEEARAVSRQGFRPTSVHSRSRPVSRASASGSRPGSRRSSYSSSLTVS